MDLPPRPFLSEAGFEQLMHRRGETAESLRRLSRRSARPADDLCAQGKPKGHGRTP